MSIATTPAKPGDLDVTTVLSLPRPARLPLDSFPGVAEQVIETARLHPTFSRAPYAETPWSYVSFSSRRGGIYVYASRQNAEWRAEDDGTVDEDPDDSGAWPVRSHEDGAVVGVLRIATQEEVSSWQRDIEAQRSEVG